MIHIAHTVEVATTTFTTDQNRSITHSVLQQKFSSYYFSSTKIRLPHSGSVLPHPLILVLNEKVRSCSMLEQVDTLKQLLHYLLYPVLYNQNARLVLIYTVLFKTQGFFSFQTQSPTMRWTLSMQHVEQAIYDVLMTRIARLKKIPLTLAVLLAVVPCTSFQRRIRILRAFLPKHPPWVPIPFPW